MRGAREAERERERESSCDHSSGRCRLDQRQGTQGTERNIARVAEALREHEAVRRRAAESIIATAAVSDEQDLSEIDVLNLLDVAAAKATASGECRMQAPAGGLRPVLVPTAGHPGDPELRWCCTGHDTEHCSSRLG
jgi:hypothetical protein